MPADRVIHWGLTGEFSTESPEASLSRRPRTSPHCKQVHAVEAPVAP